MYRCCLFAHCFLRKQADPRQAGAAAQREKGLTRHPRMGTAKEPNVCGGEHV